MTAKGAVLNDLTQHRFLSMQVGVMLSQYGQFIIQTITLQSKLHDNFLKQRSSR